MHADLEDKLAIREVVQNWAVWRDSGDWDRFQTVWHDDGYMMATWFQGPAKDFIDFSRNAFARGSMVIHTLAGTSVDVAGKRAIAQTKMEIHQRAQVHEVLSDVVCMGRFYDFFEKRNETWAIVLRQPIYEMDRIDPVDPTQNLQLDPQILGKFPEGYRHLAYLQSANGFNPKADMPGLRGEKVNELYARGSSWLAGTLASPR